MKKKPRKQWSRPRAMFLEKDPEDISIFIAVSKALGIEPEIVIYEKNVTEISKELKPDIIFVDCLYFNPSIIMDIKQVSPNSLIVVMDGNEGEKILAKEFGALQMLDKDRVMGMLRMIRRGCFPRSKDALLQQAAIEKRPRTQESIFKAMFLGKDYENMLIFSAVSDVLGIDFQVVMREEDAIGTAIIQQPDIVFVDCLDFHPRIVMNIREVCSKTIAIAVNCVRDNEPLAREFGVLATLEDYRVIEMLKMIRREIIDGETAFH